MTQEFVTLPREVVERAVEALFCTDSEEGSTAYKNELKAVKKLRAALDQPQVEQEPVAWIENSEGALSYNPYHAAARELPNGVRFDLYTRPQPKREPVGEAGPMPGADGFTMACFRVSDVSVGTELYTHPQPKREPLTKIEIADIVIDMNGNEPTALFWRDLTRAIEAAHNIK